MALESNGGTQVAKLQLNADGFIVSAGAALVIPYLSGAYDLWLFPTEAEADANNTANAIRLADNILGALTDSAIDTLLINDLSQAYEFATVAEYKAFATAFPVGKVINILERKASFTVISGVGSGVAYPYNIVSSDQVLQSISLITKGTMLLSQLGTFSDGITSDRGAFLAADALGGEWECTLGDTHLIDSAMTLSNAKFKGNKVTIKTTSHFIVVTLDASNTSFKDFKFLGINDSSYTGNSRAIFATGSTNSPAAPTYIENIDVSDNDIIGFGEYGIFLAYVKKGDARGNIVNNVGYGGVCGISCEDIKADNCYIQGVSPGSPGGDAYGQFFDRSESDTETAHPRSFRVSMCGSTIQDVIATGTNGQAIDTHGGVDFDISHNTIIACQKGIFITYSSVGGTGALAPKKIRVIGNNIDIPSGGGAVVVSGALDGVTVVEFADDVTVLGNIINGGGTDTVATSGSMIFQATKNLKANDNTVGEAFANSLYFNFSNIGFTANDNTLIDPHDSAYSAAAGILIGGSDNRGLITGNTYRINNAGLDTYVGTNSVRINAGLIGLDLDFGRSHFEGVDATHLTFLPLTTTGVRYEGLHAESGVATVNLNSGGGTGFLEESFDKRFPYVPKISLTMQFPINGGGKAPIVSTASGADKVTIYAQPYDLSSWSATGTLNVHWKAT